MPTINTSGMPEGACSDFDWRNTVASGYGGTIPGGLGARGDMGAAHAATGIEPPPRGPRRIRRRRWGVRRTLAVAALAIVCCALWAALA